MTHLYVVPKNLADFNYLCIRRFELLSFECGSEAVAGTGVPPPPNDDNSIPYEAIPAPFSRAKKFKYL